MGHVPQRPDRVESGAKPALVRRLGATYHAGTVADLRFEPDVVVECTGVGEVIAESVRGVAAGGVVCLTGVGSGGGRPASWRTRRHSWFSGTT
jgi:glucose 1-dehydrogenase